MAHELETDRLLLSQVSEVNREGFISLISNKEVIKFCFNSLDQEECESSFESRNEPWDTSKSHWLALAVTNRKTKEFIGVNGFRNTINDKEVEVGFMFEPKCYGQGFATESLVSVRDYAFELGYSSIIADVTEPNVASSKVLIKCGFVEIERKHDSVLIGSNKYTNIKYMHKA